MNNMTDIKDVFHHVLAQGYVEREDVLELPEADDGAGLPVLVHWNGIDKYQYTQEPTENILCDTIYSLRKKLSEMCPSTCVRSRLLRRCGSKLWRKILCAWGPSSPYAI